ncbi:MAG: 2-dehydro-3-deoxy-L-rhamnonate dehydrogenase [Acidobacteriaceae bacterium]|jgi:hypothetical protein|nr:2-dehydro-3-deoxy-L-rhamnonate dehydrogenase [Acidobacteriaceae bacterium]
MPAHHPTPLVNEVNQIDLKQRHAVITGGAQGIGFSVAQRIVASGASVSLWDKDVSLLKKANQDLSSLGVVSTQVVDVSEPESVATATAGTISEHGRIDILVANAGIAGPNHKTWEYPIDAWQQIIDINLTGVFFVLPSYRPAHVEIQLRTGRNRCLDRRKGRESERICLQCFESRGYRADEVPWEGNRGSQYRCQLRYARGCTYPPVRSDESGTH